MAKPNPYIHKAVHQAKVLRQYILKMNEKDKEIEAEFDAEIERQQAEKDNPDNIKKTLDTFFKEADYQDKVIADWQPESDNEEMLFLADRLLYKLMAYDAEKWIDDEKWKDEDDYEERSQLKLKEIVRNPFKLQEVIRKHVAA